MKTTLLLCFGLLGSALLFQDPTSPAPATSSEDEPPRPPYVAHLKSLEESDVAPLTEALEKLTGVDEVEAFAGKKRSVHVSTRDGDYLARTQIQAVVEAQGLALEDFEIPEWARLRLYVVEASGGG